MAQRNDVPYYLFFSILLLPALPQSAARRQIWSELQNADQPENTLEIVYYNDRTCEINFRAMGRSQSGWVCDNSTQQGGGCIYRTYLCDGFVNCPSGQDEDPAFCASRRCEADKGEDFRCQSGRCLPSALRCNGRIDCPMGSKQDRLAYDELFCSCSTSKKKREKNGNNRVEEVDDGFFCRTTSSIYGGAQRECLVRSSWCDGKRDCSGGEDENPAVCAAKDLILSDVDKRPGSNDRTTMRATTSTQSSTRTSRSTTTSTTTTTTSTTTTSTPTSTTTPTTTSTTTTRATETPSTTKSSTTTTSSTTTPIVSTTTTTMKARETPVRSTSSSSVPTTKTTTVHRSTSNSPTSTKPAIITITKANTVMAETTSTPTQTSSFWPSSSLHSSPTPPAGTSLSTEDQQLKQQLTTSTSSDYLTSPSNADNAQKSDLIADDHSTTLMPLPPKTTSLFETLGSSSFDGTDDGDDGFVTADFDETSSDPAYDGFSTKQSPLSPSHGSSSRESAWSNSEEVTQSLAIEHPGGPARQREEDMVVYIAIGTIAAAVFVGGLIFLIILNVRRSAAMASRKEKQLGNYSTVPTSAIFSKQATADHSSNNNNNNKPVNKISNGSNNSQHHSQVAENQSPMNENSRRFDNTCDENKAEQTDMAVRQPLLTGDADPTSTNNNPTSTTAKL